MQPIAPLIHFDPRRLANPSDWQALREVLREDRRQEAVAGAVRRVDRLLELCGQIALFGVSFEQCGPGTSTKPTVGIDMQCTDSSLVRGNDLVGLGVGIADLKQNDVASTTNLYAEVQKSSTSCASTSSKLKVK